MTVKELIKILKDKPQEKQVYIANMNLWKIDYYELDNVKEKRVNDAGEAIDAVVLNYF